MESVFLYVITNTYSSQTTFSFQLSVQREQDPAQTVTFRTLLLNKCQHEFEKDKLEEMDLADRQKKIDEADSVSACVVTCT